MRPWGTARMVETVSEGKRTFLVEHSWPGVTETEFAAAAERVQASAAELEREGKPVRHLHSTLVPDDEAAFCVLEAEDALLVEVTDVRAGVRFERLVEAVEARSLP